MDSRTRHAVSLQVAVFRDASVRRLYMGAVYADAARYVPTILNNKKVRADTHRSALTLLYIIEIMLRFGFARR